VSQLKRRKRRTPGEDLKRRECMSRREAETRSIKRKRVDLKEETEDGQGKK
jgi:hypothetical protein